MCVRAWNRLYLQSVDLRANLVTEQAKILLRTEYEVSTDAGERHLKELATTRAIVLKAFD